MKGFLLLCVLLLSGGQRSSACPHLCVCRGSQVDCSNKLLTTSDLPTSFPAGTTELHLHNNMLTSLPYGLLDDLTSLRSVSLHGNLWVCDCGVLYLRAWMLQQHPSLITSHVAVNCSSPPSLKGRLVMYLTEEEILSSCHYWYCDLALVSEVCLFVFVLVQAGLLVALIVFLKRFERMTKEARRATEESFTAGERLMESEFTPLKDDSIWNGKWDQKKKQKEEKKQKEKQIQISLTWHTWKGLIRMKIIWLIRSPHQLITRRSFTHKLQDHYHLPHTCKSLINHWRGDSVKSKWRSCAVCTVCLCAQRQHIKFSLFWWLPCSFQQSQVLSLNQFENLLPLFPAFNL